VGWRCALLPTLGWLCLELVATSSTCYLGADRAVPPSALPEEKVRAIWRQSSRLLWIACLSGLLLLLGWASAALDAAEAGRKPALELLLPLLLGLGLVLSCAGCVGSALRRQRPESRRRRAGPGGVAGGGSSLSGSTPTSGGALFGSGDGGGSSSGGSTPRGQLRLGSGWDGAVGLEKGPPTAEEAQMAADIMRAVYLDHSGPLPGAMPNAVTDAMPDWTEAFDGLAEALADEAAVEEGHGQPTVPAAPSRNGAPADAPEWMLAFGDVEDGDDEEAPPHAGEASAALEDPPSDWEPDA